MTDDIADLIDVGLGEILANKGIRNIPFISTAVSIYNIGSTLREREHIKKLGIFLQEIDDNIASKKDTEEYKQNIIKNHKFREKELEFIIILLDRYLQYEKPEILAKLYIAYLDRKINLEIFSTYASTIEYLLPQDIKLLCEKDMIIIEYNKMDHNTARLIAFGLITETRDDSPFAADGNNLIVTGESMGRTFKNEKEYKVTEFGKKLVDIIKYNL